MCPLPLWSASAIPAADGGRQPLPLL